MANSRCLGKDGLELSRRSAEVPSSERSYDIVDEDDEQAAAPRQRRRWPWKERTKSRTTTTDIKKFAEDLLQAASPGGVRPDIAVVCWAVSVAVTVSTHRHSLRAPVAARSHAQPDRSRLAHQACPLRWACDARAPACGVRLKRQDGPIEVSRPLLLTGCDQLYNV